jgi:hypothetical protein
MLPRIFCAVPILAAVSLAASLPSYDQAFWSTWGDGQAELAGYDLTIPRYNQPRHGVAITVFVTETFSNSIRVKADPGKHPASDEYPVMKLNLVKDYQTGIYDYNEMTSSFVALQPVNGRAAGSPTKISFSRQEWCGLTYHQLLFDAKAIRAVRHSYFDGDADRQRELDYPADGVAEDGLMLWARGIGAPALAPGESRSVPLLPSLPSLKGIDATWITATLSRSAKSQSLTVPAGTFTVEAMTVRTSGNQMRTFYVEQAAPHRLVKWETSAGERGELLKSDRMKYWQMNGEGYEKALSRIGLTRRPPRTP